MRAATWPELIVAALCLAAYGAGALSALLDVPASTLSFHLKELLHSGLVTQERDGRSLIYRPSLDRMNALLDYLTAHCCQGEPCDLRPERAGRAC